MVTHFNILTTFSPLDLWRIPNSGICIKWAAATNSKIVTQIRGMLCYYKICDWDHGRPKLHIHSGTFAEINTAILLPILILSQFLSESRIPLFHNGRCISIIHDTKIQQRCLLASSRAGILQWLICLVDCSYDQAKIQLSTVRNDTTHWYWFNIWAN